MIAGGRDGTLYVYERDREKNKHQKAPISMGTLKVESEAFKLFSGMQGLQGRTAARREINEKKRTMMREMCVNVHVSRERWKDSEER